MHISQGAQAQSPNAPHQKCHNSISLARAATHSINGNDVMERVVCISKDCEAIAMRFATAGAGSSIAGLPGVPCACPSYVITPRKGGKALECKQHQSAQYKYICMIYIYINWSPSAKKHGDPCSVPAGEMEGGKRQGEGSCERSPELQKNRLATHAG